MNGLVPCSFKCTGIFYTCVSVKMCRSSKFAVLLITVMFIKYGEDMWNAGQCFLNLLTVGEGQG